MGISKIGLVTISLLIVLSGIYIYYLFFGIAYGKSNILDKKNKSIFHDIENTPPGNIVLKKTKRDCNCD